MKLIDILVEETIKNGWSWPERANCITQDSDREIVSAGCHPDDAKFCSYRHGWNLKASRIESFESRILADDYATSIITREQYEAALDAKNEGWVEWAGGKCPVDSSAIVDVKLQTGVIHANRLAGEYSWKHEWTYSNIIAYRLHQPQEAEQAEADDEADLNECISQDASPFWNGEGLPPVGCECEVSVDGGRSWCTYRAINEKNGARLIEISNFTEEFQNNNWIFRPLRTEAERKRDDICDKIYGAMTNAKRKDNRSDMAEEIYDAIAAGKIHGVKLED